MKPDRRDRFHCQLQSKSSSFIMSCSSDHSLLDVSSIRSSLHAQPFRQLSPLALLHLESELVPTLFAFFPVFHLICMSSAEIISIDKISRLTKQPIPSLILSDEYRSAPANPLLPRLLCCLPTYQLLVF
jgi:hypothetical protein